MGIQMMKNTGTYDDYVVDAQTEGYIIAFHGIFTFKRHHDLNSRMPVVRIFFIICVVVKEKGRIVLKTDRFLYAVKDLYHFLLHSDQNCFIINKLTNPNFCKKIIQ